MKEIEISNEKPPVLQKLSDRFGVKWENGIIVAYGGKIYCSMEVQPQKIIHEKVHLDRQEKIGNDIWWGLYLDNDSFRLEEEALAYKAEADFIRKYIKNREHRFHMINEIADSFSSSVYGNIISKQEALKILL